MTAAARRSERSDTTEPVLVTAALAEKAANLRYDDLSTEARTVAGHCFMDFFGVTLAARHEPLANILAEQIAEDGGTPQATVIGRGTRANIEQAALLEWRDVARARFRRRELQPRRPSDRADCAGRAGAGRTSQARRQAAAGSVRRGLRNRMPHRPAGRPLALPARLAHHGHGRRDWCCGSGQQHAAAGCCDHRACARHCRDAGRGSEERVRHHVQAAASGPRGGDRPAGGAARAARLHQQSGDPRCRAGIHRDAVGGARTRKPRSRSRRAASTCRRRSSSITRPAT